MGQKDLYMEQNMEHRLWDYIDGNNTAEDQSFVGHLIATREEWRKKYHELMEVDQITKDGLELEEPSLRFSRNVMEAISRYHITPAARTYVNKKVIYAIGIFFLVMIATLLLYSFAQINWLQSSPANPDLFSTYNPSKIGFSKYLNTTYNTVFMMVNVVMGLMLLDMYLAKKRKEVL